MTFVSVEHGTCSAAGSQRLRDQLRHFFCRDESGSTAVEFGMIAPVFIGAIAIFLFMGYMFVMATTLEDGVREAGRQIRIGAVDTSGMSRTQFKTLVCTYVSMDKTECLSSLIVDVDSAATIAGLPDNDPRTDGELDDAASAYNPGGTSDYVVVKAYLPYSSLSSLFKMLGASSTKKFTLSSTTVFRSEPF